VRARGVAGDGTDAGVDRRLLLKGAAGLGAAAWVAPQILSVDAAAATVLPFNLALQGTATQSSTFDPFTFAARANNGIILPNTYPTNVAITEASDLPQAQGLGAVPADSQWWNVDLGASHAVTSVVVTNRDAATGIPERSQNLAVYVDGVLAAVIPGTTGTWQTATLTMALTGQNFTIVNGTGVGTPTPTYLQLAEVEVFGT
jgi:hypothetical protein